MRTLFREAVCTSTNRDYHCYLQTRHNNAWVLVWWFELRPNSALHQIDAHPLLKPFLNSYSMPFGIEQKPCLSERPATSHMLAYATHSLMAKYNDSSWPICIPQDSTQTCYTEVGLHTQEYILMHPDTALSNRVCIASADLCVSLFFRVRIKLYMITTPTASNWQRI